MKKDIINHPSHYTQAAVTVTFEPVDLTERLPHPIASAVEYLLRAGKKEGVPEEVDLQKARWWLRRAHNNQSLWNTRLVVEPNSNGDELCRMDALKGEDPLRDLLLRAFATKNVFIKELIEASVLYDLYRHETVVTMLGIEDCITKIEERLRELGIEPKELTE